MERVWCAACGGDLQKIWSAGCCQTNSNKSQFATECVNLSGTKLAPLGKSSASGQFKILTRVKMAFLIEVVVDGGMDGSEFLQTSHLSKALHGPFSSSKRQMGILGPIVHPAASFLLVGIADNLHGRAVGSELVGHQDMRAAVAFH